MFALLLQASENSDFWGTWGSLTMGMTVIILGMLFLGLLAWQAFKTWQIKLANRAAVALDERYRALSEDAVATQQRLLETQERLVADMTDLRGRLTSIEQLLRQVE